MAKRPKLSNQLPTLPGGVLVGVLKDFVETYVPTTECPSPFLWSSFATVLGDAVSPYVARDNALRTEPRLYTANIGQSGVSRRSTGAKRATDVIKIALGQTGIQMVNGFGSMEGLLRVLQNANGVPVLNYFDELELMFKKALVPEAPAQRRYMYSTKKPRTAIRCVRRALSIWSTPTSATG